MLKRTASSTSWMVPSVPWPVSWLTGCQQTLARSGLTFPGKMPSGSITRRQKRPDHSGEGRAGTTPASRTPRQVGSYGRRVTACKHVRRLILGRWALDAGAALWRGGRMRLIRGTGMHEINHEAPINHVSRTG